ncbi:MAG: fimbrillin family protein [Muribaculaceae bacterium]|nr:fimbrillin family protein [Muribaculaceae bacterium]
MKKTICLTCLWSCMAALSSCGSDNSSPAPEPEPDKPAKMQIKINASTSASRVSDNSFDNGDHVGLFVVNYAANNQGSLSLAGNHADNVAFRFNGAWTSDAPIYWKDETTHADFYLYYPYSPSLNSVSAIPFEVKADQSSEQDYKASELLAGKALDIAPTQNAVNITARHLMSRIEIILEAGDGFKADDLTADKVAVKVNDVMTAATLDLAACATTAVGEKRSVVPRFDNRIYRALLPPQTVAETNLITVTTGGRDFNLRRAFTFSGGTVHKFTIRLSKTSNGVNVNISPWENDGTDNGGVAE